MAYIENFTLADFSIALRKALLWALNRMTAVETSGGRIKVVLDATAGAQTLGTVTTVSTVSSVTAVAAVTTHLAMTAMPAMPYRDAEVTPKEKTLWASTVRARIS